MEIIRGYNGAHMAVLGEQPVWYDKEYVWAKHCLIVDVKDGKLILNGLTRAIVFLEPNEYYNVKDIKSYLFLYKTYFLVPKDFNSDMAIDNIREKLKKPVDSFYLDNPHEFTILTTTKCNARCFYCYELSSKHKHHMTNETALKVAKYIDNVAPKEEILHLNWFGGEPLFNLKVIDLIINYLISKHRTFNSSITSNGYLLDETMIDKAISKWNLNFAQITIDGTEHTYNKAKNYIYDKETSPYKKVMHNIELLLDRDIMVSIRINLDVYNIEDSQKLIQEIYEMFGIRQNIRIYLYPLFDDLNPRSKEDEDKVYNGLANLEKLILDLGYTYGFYPDEEIMSSHCMADIGSHVLISPDGDLGTCEHFIDTDFFSHIDTPWKKDYDILNGWREYTDALEICKDCPIYGSCIRPVKCFEKHKCSERVKEWNIRKASYNLINYYNDYKNERNLTA